MAEQYNVDIDEQGLDYLAEQAQNLTDDYNKQRDAERATAEAEQNVEQQALKEQFVIVPSQTQTLRAQMLVQK